MLESGSGLDLAVKNDSSHVIHSPANIIARWDAFLLQFQLFGIYSSSVGVSDEDLTWTKDLGTRG